MPLKRLLSIVVFSFSIVFANAQQETADLGIFAGYGTTFGEVTYSSLPSFAVFFRYNENSRFAYRFNFNYGNFNSGNPSIFNGSALLEINYLDFILGVEQKKFSPYVFGGVSAGFAKGSFIGIPFGTGLKYGFIKKFGVGAELMLIKTFSDEIDGLPLNSENFISSDPAHNNDWVNYVGITFWYKIYMGRKPCPTYGSKY